jgi:hypothetical protein
VAKKRKSSSNKDSFRLTPKRIFRWLIFSALVYFLINYLSQNSTQKLPPSVLGQISYPSLAQNQVNESLPAYLQSLPPEKQELVDATLEEIKKFTDRVKELLNGFPQKQIQEIRKEIITQIYQKLVDQ